MGPFLKNNNLKAKKNLEEKLTRFLASDRNNDSVADIIDTKIQLYWEVDKEEVYREQCARANWLRLGDKNTAFFHHHALTPNRYNKITRLSREDGVETFDEAEMRQVATNYFTSLFHGGAIGDFECILRGVESSLSEEDNQQLTASFSEKVLSALKGMGATKADFDGFSVLFFLQYWHIVGPDVLRHSLGILNEGQSPSIANRIEIVLILKIQNPTNLVNFRSISLCSVPYKIVAKAIANRLQHVIGKCIDYAQGAFIPNRLITDNVLIAYELLHEIKMKRYENKGVIAFKARHEKKPMIRLNGSF